MPAAAEKLAMVKLKCSRVEQRTNASGVPTGLVAREVGDEIEVPADEAERMVEAGQAAYIRGGGK